jgi:hypothetical protein
MLSPLINKVFDKFCSQNGEAKFGWRNGSTSL